MPEPAAPPSIAFILCLFLGSFLLLWSGVVFLISRVSGWASLAAAYPGPKDARPARWRYRSAYLRLGARYNGVLCFDADADGFTVAPIWLFRLGHATLRVPWTDVTAVEQTWFFLPFVKLTLSRVPGVPFRIPAGFARELLSARAEPPPAFITPR